MGDAGPTRGEADSTAFSRLRRGDLVGAMRVVEGVSADRRSARLAVLAAEVGGCLGRWDLEELERLQGLVAAEDVTLRLRVEAVRADYYALRGDPLCALVATDALAVVGDGPVLQTELLWARGRLHRALAFAATLAHEVDGADSSMRSLERAMADLSRAGFDAEAARSAAEVHVAWCYAHRDGYDRAHDMVVECLARLRELGSSYMDLVLAYRVALDLAKGDLVAMQAGIVEIDEIAAERPVHPITRVLVGGARVASRLIGEGPTAGVVEAMDEQLARVRSEATPLAAAEFVAFAAVLVDAGHTQPEHLALARRWATQATAGAPGTLRTARDRSALLARLDLLERGDAAAVTAVDADLEAGRRLGLRRDAAQRGLQAAMAARRVGRDDVAERLHMDAIAALPPPERRTLWENALVAGMAAIRRPGCSAPRLQLLGPEVTIEIGSRRHALSVALARLVVALVAEGGAASVDRIIDTLWPDVDLTVGRARLRVTLHRLRRCLDFGQGIDSVLRRGNMLAIAPGVEVDTMRFEKLSTGSVTERRAAVEMWQGDVARGQLAYDDIAGPLRGRLGAIWQDTARDVLAGTGLPHSTARHIAAVATRGADTDPELADLARVAERRYGGNARELSAISHRTSRRGCR